MCYFWRRQEPLPLSSPQAFCCPHMLLKKKPILGFWWWFLCVWCLFGGWVWVFGVFIGGEGVGLGFFAEGAGGSSSRAVFIYHIKAALGSAKFPLLIGSSLQGITRQNQIFGMLIPIVTQLCLTALANLLSAINVSPVPSQPSHREACVPLSQPGFPGLTTAAAPHLCLQLPSASDGCTSREAAACEGDIWPHAGSLTTLHQHVAPLG